MRTGYREKQGYRKFEIGRLNNSFFSQKTKKIKTYSLKKCVFYKIKPNKPARMGLRDSVALRNAEVFLSKSCFFSFKIME